MNNERRSQAKIEEIVQTYKELGTLREVGDRYGISLERVRQIIAKYEYETNQHVPRIGRTSYSEQQIESMIAKRLNGDNWADIAEDVGFSRGETGHVQEIIWRYLRRKGRNDEVPTIWRYSNWKWLMKDAPMHISNQKIH